MYIAVLIIHCRTRVSPVDIGRYMNGFFINIIIIIIVIVCFILLKQFSCGEYTNFN